MLIGTNDLVYVNSSRCQEMKTINHQEKENSTNAKKGSCGHKKEIKMCSL